MLGDLDLLDLLADGGAITGSVLSDDTDLLSVLCLEGAYVVSTGALDGWMEGSRVETYHEIQIESKLGLVLDPGPACNGVAGAGFS